LTPLRNRRKIFYWRN